MPHLQIALAYRSTLQFGSAEYDAVDELITKLIESCTFTYADAYEYAEYIARKAAQ